MYFISKWSINPAESIRVKFKGFLLHLNRILKLYYFPAVATDEIHVSANEDRKTDATRTHYSKTMYNNPSELYVSSNSTICGCFSMWHIVASRFRSTPKTENYVKFYVNSVYFTSNLPSVVSPGLLEYLATSTILTANWCPVCLWTHFRTKLCGPLRTKIVVSVTTVGDLRFLDDERTYASTAYGCERDTTATFRRKWTIFGESGMRYGQGGKLILREKITPPMEVCNGYASDSK